MYVGNDERTYLDDEDYERRIGDLKPGETGYIVPWVIGVDVDGGVYLSLNTTISKNYGGTCNVAVSKDKKGKYRLSFLQPGYKFQRSNSPRMDTSDTITYNLTIRL